MRVTSASASRQMWRLNTETGHLQFCYVNGVYGINCSMWVKPPEMPLYQ